MSFDAEVEKSIMKSPTRDDSSQNSSVSSSASTVTSSLPTTPTSSGTRGGSVGALSSTSVIKGGSTKAARPTSIALKPAEGMAQESSAYEKGYQACLILFREKQKQQQELKKMQQAQKEDASAYKKGYLACLEFFKNRPLSQALTPENIGTLKTLPGAQHGRAGDSLPGTPLGALAGTPLGSLPGTPLANLLHSLPGTPLSQMKGLARTLQKDAQSPIAIVPSSPLTSPRGSPMLPLYARPPVVNPARLGSPASMASPVGLAGTAALRSPAGLAGPALLRSPVGLTSPAGLASPVGPIGLVSPAGLASPVALASPGHVASSAHAISPSLILSPGNSVRSPGHVGSPAQMISSSHLPSQSRTVVTGFPGPGARPTGFPGPSSLIKEEPPQKVQVMSPTTEMPRPNEPTVLRSNKALHIQAVNTGHVSRSKPSRAEGLPAPPRITIPPPVPKQQFSEVPDSPLLQLATAAITQAARISVPPKEPAHQTAPESVKDERPSVTSTESYIESDASRSSLQSTSCGK